MAMNPADPPLIVSTEFEANAFGIGRRCHVRASCEDQRATMVGGPPQVSPNGSPNISRPSGPSASPATWIDESSPVTSRSAAADQWSPSADDWVLIASGFVASPTESPPAVRIATYPPVQPRTATFVWATDSPDPASIHATLVQGPAGAAPTGGRGVGEGTRVGAGDGEAVGNGSEGSVDTGDAEGSGDGEGDADGGAAEHPAFR